MVIGHPRGAAKYQHDGAWLGAIRGRTAALRHRPIRIDG
jgi:hypothetical protein